MNPYMMPDKLRKEREFLSFAQMVVVALSIGMAIAWVIYKTQWGF